MFHDFTSNSWCPSDWKKMSSSTWVQILNGHRTVGSGHLVVSQDFTQPGLQIGQLQVHRLATGICPNLSHLNFQVWGYNPGSVCKCKVAACQNVICCLARAHTPVSICVTLLSCETGKVYTLNTCYSSEKSTTVQTRVHKITENHRMSLLKSNEPFIVLKSP